ncbi:MAG: DNA primase [Clostridiales bacterium]|nr:DNA primase [Clostridiales bacterium]
MAGELKEFITTLKEKINIVDVASGYVSLERRGNSYWACCPFHHEKTPSFSINEAEQFYHCFGCGESGDVIGFVKNIENVEFMEAIKLLADRANLTVPQTGFDSMQTVESKRKRDAILKILNETAHFYLNNLNSGKAEEHIQYILNRKIPTPIVRKFGLGASLNFNDLPRFLLDKGFQKQDMIDSGVVNEVNGRLTDAQGGRLIIPIINAMNEVIAFGGRALKKVDFGKYKNTKETVVFNKSKALYNINLLKKLRKEKTVNNIIVVEGYMDVISLYSAGFTNVVASMGTSLTQDQARLLKRYSDNVLISYDGDAAGQKANMRGLDILKGEGLNVKVVPLPDGLDPDDVIKQLGPQGYQNCLDSAQSLIDFKLNAAKKNYDINKSEDKYKYVKDAVKIIKTADSAAEQEDLLKALRDETGLTYESLSRDLNAQPQTPKAETKAPSRRKDTSSNIDKASRFVIAAYLSKAQFTDGADINNIPFSNQVHRIIARYVKSKKLFDEAISKSEIFEFFEQNTPEYAELTRILDYSEDAFSDEISKKFFFDCIKKLQLNEIDGKISLLKQQVQKEEDLNTRKTLAAALQELLKKRSKIKSQEG